MWHPGEDRLVYERGGSVWELSVPGWQTRRILTSGEGAAVSRDGQWVAYMVPGEEGIWVRAYDDLNGPGAQLVEYGSDPFWLTNDTLGMQRAFEGQATLQRQAQEYVAFTTLKLAFQPATPSRVSSASKADSGETGAAVLGLTLFPLNDVLKAVYGATTGVLVENVDAGSPGAQAGITAEDVVTRYAGIRVQSVEELTRWLRDTKPGALVEVEVLRKGALMTLKLAIDGDRAK